MWVDSFCSCGQEFLAEILNDCRRFAIIVGSLLQSVKWVGAPNDWMFTFRAHFLRSSHARSNIVTMFRIQTTE